MGQERESLSVNKGKTRAITLRKEALQNSRGHAAGKGARKTQPVWRGYFHNSL